MQIIKVLVKKNSFFNSKLLLFEFVLEEFGTKKPISLKFPILQIL